MTILRSKNEIIHKKLCNRRKKKTKLIEGSLRGKEKSKTNNGKK